MNATQDQELEESHEKIGIRQDLKFHIRSDQRIVLEDPVRGKHYRLGVPEYDFLISLRNTGDAVAAHQAAIAQSAEWNTDSTQQLLSWLAARGLVSVRTEEFNNPSPPTASRAASLNPLFARISFGSPDRFVRTVAQFVRPCFRREVAWVVAAICCHTLWVLATSWSEFLGAYNNLLTGWRASSLLVVGLLLKLIHEMAHALACQRWGGKVRDCGLAFIFGVPLPFVDLSDSCRFPDRSQRIMVALAGVLVECLLGALLVCLWSVTDSPFIERLAADTLLVVALGTLLFNLNPLMRFDGYYVLVEFLGIDNLYQLGATYVGALRSRILFGKSETATVEISILVKLYGLASFLWRILATLTICCTAIVTLHGIGIILVAWTLYISYARPAIAAWRVQKGNTLATGYRVSSWRWLMRPICVISAGILAVCVIPLPTENSGNAVVEFDPPAVVRILVDGFVDQIHVEDGQEVRKGELLVTLVNDRLPLELTSCAKKLSLLEQELKSAVLREDSAEFRDVQAELMGLRNQHTEILARHELLEVRAPEDGVVSASNVNQLLGIYLESGTEIGRIGTECSKRLRILAQQDSTASLVVGDPLRFLSSGGYQGIAQVFRIQPRAITTAVGSALSAEMGGPVSVEMDQEGNANFCFPQSQVLASLEPVLSKQLRVGQCVSVALGNRQRIGEWLWDICVDRLRRS